MNRKLTCLAGILFGLSSTSALAISKAELTDALNALPSAISFTGEISTVGEIDYYGFTMNTDGYVLFDVLADEYETDPQGSVTYPTYDWDTQTWDPYDDKNGDGVATFLDSQLFLLRDDGSLSADDNIDYMKLYNPSGTKTHLMQDQSDAFLFGNWGEDRNDSSAEGSDPLAYFDLSAGDYVLAIGAQEDLTIGDVVNGFNPGAFTCSEGSECQSLGTYRIDIYGNDVTENDLNPVPIPAALPLFASALGFMGFAGWKRRLKG